MATTVKELSQFASGLMRGRLDYGGEETRFRAVVNRTYYTAYPETRDFVRLEGTHDAHSRVRREISRYKIYGEEIELRLEELSDLRIKADYNLDADITHENAKRSVELMEEILKLVGQLRHEMALQKVSGCGSRKRAARRGRRRTGPGKKGTDPAR